MIKKGRTFFAKIVKLRDKKIQGINQKYRDFKFELEIKYVTLYGNNVSGPTFCLKLIVFYYMVTMFLRQIFAQILYKLSKFCHYVITQKIILEGKKHQTKKIVRTMTFMFFFLLFALCL